MFFLRLMLVLAMPLTLAACSGTDRDIRMRSFQDAEGPEEFAIIPGKALEAPKSYNELPAPTPGGTNRADLTPKADAVTALGGRASALTPSGVPASEGGLVNYASRKGRDPQIRATLVKEDEDFRRSKSRFTRIRLFKSDRYYQAYRRQTLDPHTIANRYRRAGAPTPTAPPRER